MVAESTHFNDESAGLEQALIRFAMLRSARGGQP
jgi:hypothetical protein